MNNSTLSSTGNWEDRQGWTSSPNGRGTMSIIWSCAITTFLCCWSVLVINLPQPGSSSSSFSIIARKFLLVGLCGLAPELIFQAALGQWLSARRALQLFHGSGYHEWTLRCSFFVDMGGLHLESPDYPVFPINAQQLHYLVIKEYVQYPRIEESQIRDKNKVDTTLRFITLFQTVFFLINLIIRTTQGLAVTALELSTSAFVVVGLMTTLCWLRKPADVQSREVISTKTPIARILAERGIPADAVYTYTPLDPIGRKEWSWSILWMHGLGYLRRLHLAGQPQQLPVQRFNNTAVPNIDGWFLVLFAFVCILYFSIFIIGWNFSFPTIIEQTLWRSATLIALLDGWVFIVFELVYFKWFPLRRKSEESPPEPIARLGSQGRTLKFRNKILDKLQAIGNKFDAFLALLRNNSISNDPAFDAPAGAILGTWFFGGLYVAARAYILTADLIELRSLPASAYESLNWASLAPYVP